MSDEQLPRIVLPPTSDLTGSASSQITPPPIPVSPTPLVKATPPAVAAPSPLPTPPLATAKVPAMSAPSTTQLQQRQVDLQQQRDAIGKEENKLLGTIKEWIAWIQGAETKKQAIERELWTLDHTLQNVGSSSTPTGPSRHDIEQQLRSADMQLKTVQNQQKIEEKKAFDRYASGGLNREGLMKEMDQISERYSEQLIAAKAKAAGLHEQLEKMSAPTTAPTAVSPAPQPATTTTTPTEKILERLCTLERAQAGEVRRLLVELPQQGQQLTIQRSADGNGIIVLAGTETNYIAAQHFPDADLLRTGLGINDIVNLPTGQLAGSQLSGLQNLTV